MNPILFDDDPLTGVREIWHGDIHSGEKNIIETVQDVEPLVEANKRLYNRYDERGQNFKGDGFHRVAAIPPVVMMDLEKRGILKDQKAFLRWLDDPENRHFRTMPGKLSR